MSRVQQLGLEILLILDEQKEQQRSDEAMRLALLTANSGLARGLYPEYFDPMGETEEVVEMQGGLDLDAPGTDFDFSGVTFQAPQDLGNDDWNMLERMLGNSNVTVTTPMAPPEGVNNNHLRLPDEPDDGEWI